MNNKHPIRPGKMIEYVLRALWQKPATINYPFVKAVVPKNYRGQLNFIPEKCTGCLLCMKDCPADAIHITKLADKKFEMEIDLGRCIYCGQCVDSCPRQALEITPEFELALTDRSKLKVVFHAEPDEGDSPEA